MNVIGVDVSQHAVDTINAGNVHNVEPDLDIVVGSAVKADAFMVEVSAPFKDNYEADLSYIQMAANMIALELEKGNLVILGSTSPVGATEMLHNGYVKHDPIQPFRNHMVIMPILR